MRFRADGIVIGSMLVLLVAGILMWKGYVPSPWTDSSPGGVSALAPSDWQLAEADVWSIAYPSDWSAVQREGDGAYSFRAPDYPTNSRLVILNSIETFVAVKNQYATDGLAFRSTDITFANYEAVKYDYGSGRTDYVIHYVDRTVIIATEYPNDDDVGIMLAAFAFTK